MERNSGVLGQQYCPRLLVARAYIVYPTLGSKGELYGRVCVEHQFGGGLSVKSCYNRFKVNIFGPPFNSFIVKASNHLWKVKTPCKILFFRWKILHNRLATKDQLHKRAVLVDSSDLSFVFCLLEEKCLPHLLGGCVVVASLWNKVFEWFGPIEEISLEEFEWYFVFGDKVKNIVKRRIVAVI